MSLPLRRRDGVGYLFTGASPPDPTAERGSISEQTLRRVVNVGLVAVARVQGVPAGERLRLRCECGARSCVASVEATAGEHHDDGCSILMISPAHRGAVSGRVAEANERFLKLSTGGEPGGIGCP